MSLERILQNIHSFLDVLVMCRSEAVASWDNRALQRAINWAAYCQQIYKQAAGKPYQSQLDAKIRLLSTRVQTLGNDTVCLELLGGATELLIRGLLNNHHVNTAVIEFLVKECTSGRAGHVGAVTSQVCADLCGSTFDEKQCPLVLLDSDTSFPRQLDVKRTTGKSNADNKREFKLPLYITGTFAKLLLENCVYHIKYPSDDLYSSEEMLRRKLKELLQVKNGLELMLMCLVLETEETFMGQHHLSNARQLVLEVVLRFMEEESSRSVLLACSVPLLVNVCNAHLLFFRSYIGHLVSLGRTLSPHISQLGEPLQWRLKHERGFSCVTYQRLVRHFQGLLGSRGAVANTIETTLQGLAETSTVNVWKTLLGHIRT